LFLLFDFYPICKCSLNMSQIDSFFSIVLFTFQRKCLLLFFEFLFVLFSSLVRFEPRQFWCKDDDNSIFFYFSFFCHFKFVFFEVSINRRILNFLSILVLFENNSANDISTSDILLVELDLNRNPTYCFYTRFATKEISPIGRIL